MVSRSAPVLLAVGMFLIPSCASVQEDNAILEEASALLDLAELQELAEQGDVAEVGRTAGEVLNHPDCAPSLGNSESSIVFQKRPAVVRLPVGDEASS